MFSKLVKADQDLFLYINRTLAHPKSVVTVYKYIDYVTYQALIWVVLLIGARVITNSPTLIKYIDIGIFLFLADISVEFFLKNIFRRPRPALTLRKTKQYALEPKTYSFPSGHTLMSISLATYFSLVVVNPLFTMLALGAAIIISFGRIYIGTHYPLDVIFGGLIGILMGTGAYMFFV